MPKQWLRSQPQRCAAEGVAQRHAPVRPISDHATEKFRRCSGLRSRAHHHHRCLGCLTITAPLHVEIYSSCRADCLAAWLDYTPRTEEQTERALPVQQVGASVLSRVLGRLQQDGLGRDGVLVGLDEGDDAAVVRPPPAGHVSVHTVDFFRSFIGDPYVFGRVAAVHALGVSLSPS